MESSGDKSSKWVPRHGMEDKTDACHVPRHYMPFHMHACPRQPEKLQGSDLVGTETQ